MMRARSANCRRPNPRSRRRRLHPMRLKAAAVIFNDELQVFGLRVRRIVIADACACLSTLLRISWVIRKRFTSNSGRSRPSTCATSSSIANDHTHGRAGCVPNPIVIAGGHPKPELAGRQSRIVGGPLSPALDPVPFKSLELVTELDLFRCYKAQRGEAELQAQGARFTSSTWTARSCGRILSFSPQERSEKFQSFMRSVWQLRQAAVQSRRT